MQRRLIGALATGLAAWLTVLAAPASAATITYTFSGTTLNDGYLNGHPDPVPGPLPFTFTLYFSDNLSPVSGNYWVSDDPRDSYTIGGQQAFYQGLGGFFYMDTDFHTGLPELYVEGDTIIDYGFFKARSGYGFHLVSSALTADYAHPGVYTDANAQLNPPYSGNYTIIQTLGVPGQVNNAQLTYLDVDKFVITNSDYPSVVPPAVPLPASLPLFGAALAALGFIGFRVRRLAGMTSTLSPGL